MVVLRRARAALLCAIVLWSALGASAVAAPTWSLTMSGDPNMVVSNRIDQSTAKLDINIVQFRSESDPLPSFLRFMFDIQPRGVPHVSVLEIGRNNRFLATPDPLLPGAYTDLRPSTDPGAGQVAFQATLVDEPATTCGNQRTTLTIHAIEFVDVLDTGDTGIAYLDLDFTTTCSKSNGDRSSFNGHLLYEDQSRRPPLVTILHGKVWEDRNTNGLREPDEPTVAGVTVAAKAIDRFGSVKSGRARAIDSNGDYELHLPPGTYRVQFKPPSVYFDPPSGQSTLAPAEPNIGIDDTIDSDVVFFDMTDLMALTSGDVRGPDAGFRDALTTLEGHAWFDANRNGVREDSESALPVTVCFFRDPTILQQLGCMAADETGYYKIETYLPQVSVVIKDPQAGWTASPLNGTLDETRDSDMDLQQTNAPTYRRGGRRSVFDLGAYPIFGSVSGTVWEDRNFNGVREPGEPGIAGLSLELRQPGVFGPVGGALTDANGRYTLAVREGSYFLEFVRPSATRFRDYVMSPRRVGTDRTIDSDFDSDTLRSANLTIVGGGDLTDLDAGFADPPHMPIRGRAWLDSDGNGVMNKGEARLPKVELMLFRDGVYHAQLRTNAKGEYEYSAPIGHRYRVDIGRRTSIGNGLVPTRLHARGVTDSDMHYEGVNDTLLTSAAPLVRDIGLFRPTAVIPLLAEYFPMSLGNKWTFRSTDDDRLVVCSINRQDRIDGALASRFKCSSGASYVFSITARGLILHSLRTFGIARVNFSDQAATIEANASPALVLARSRRRPGDSFSGRSDADGRLTTAGRTVSGPASMTYRSSLRADTGSIEGWRAPQLRVTLTGKGVAKDDSGLSLSLGLGLELAQGIGPVAFFDPDTGRVSAILESYVQDGDKDGRVRQRDNCPDVKNAIQLDGDHDGVGDACDEDLDDDRVANVRDNCPRVWNQNQADADGDGRGDACTVRQ